MSELLQPLEGKHPVLHSHFEKRIDVSVWKTVQPDFFLSWKEVNDGANGVNKMRLLSALNILQIAYVSLRLYVDITGMQW